MTKETDALDITVVDVSDDDLNALLDNVMDGAITLEEVTKLVNGMLPPETD